VLENGVVSKYILGDAKAPWFGGSAALSSKFVKEYPETTAAYAEAYRRAVHDIRDNPTEVRQYLTGYTAIEGDLVEKVPMVGYTMYDEFTAEDIAYFQKFFDFMTEKEIFSRPIDVAALMYKPA
jgi:NitT/TauT family transport system substrate-binding protein